MRKLSLLLCLLILAAKVTKAQDQKFHFGLKITPSMAWIKPDNKGVERDGRRLGFGYGIQTEFRFQDNYAIASGVQVTYRGGNLRTEIGDSSGTTEIVTKNRLQYVEIPVCLKMKTNEFGKMRYFGQFGFSPGFNLAAKADTDIEDDIDIKDGVNLFNMNMIIGAGAEYTISGSTVLFGGIEFNNGFLDVFEGSGSGRTNYLGLSIGVLF
jgi:hypothetical protein